MKRGVGAFTAMQVLLAAALSAQQPEESRQFDFWIGEWDVNLRILQEDLSWQDSVRSVAKIYPILDGKAILELWDSQPIKGYSLRYYDADRGRWVLWLNWPGENRSGQSSLEGSFRHGRGELFSSSRGEDGGELISRYTFSDITADSLRWDDAYSKDGGKTWTHQWIMEFSRGATTASWPAPGLPAHTFDTGARCDRQEFRRLDFLAGVRTGSVDWRTADGSWRESPATLVGQRVLDGCAVHASIESSRENRPYRVFAHLTFNTYIDRFEEGRLDNAPTTPFYRSFGVASDAGLELLHRDSREAPPTRKTTWRDAGDGVVEAGLFTSSDGGLTWDETERARFRK